MLRILLFIIITTFFACTNKKSIVEQSYTDSIILNAKPSQSELTMQQDLLFWENRVEKLPFDIANLQKYAQALSSRFHYTGNIMDLKKADSIIRSLNNYFKGKEPGYLLTLASFELLQHRFKDAKAHTDSVIMLNAEPYAAKMMLFDALFETGNILEAEATLRANRLTNDFAYNFRLSKLDHYNGNLDSAIAHMLEAAKIAVSNKYLRQVALSNAADLYIHKGNLKEAYKLYKQCIQLKTKR